MLLSLWGALILSVLPCLSQAQQDTDVYYAQQLWVQLAPEKAMRIASDKKEVDLQTFLEAFDGAIPDQYGITQVRKPFYYARKAEVSEVYEIHFSAENAEDAFADELGRMPGIGYAERIPIMRPTYTPNDIGPQSGTANQYGLWNIQAQEAWDITTGNTEVKVAIVDDAVLVTHPDLIPNLVPGYDVSEDNNDPMPNLPAMTHGTHVAGIVGAATDNGIGVASVGFNIKIMPVKSSNAAQFVTDAYAGVVWAAENGADVINMSWGGSGFSQTGQNIINLAHSNGVVNVAAAGNDGVSSVFYPAGYDNVLSVSSTTANDSKSGFSNYGAWIDVSAPGSNILSTYHNSFEPSYAAISGTSMASPMVAGLAGLVLSVNPEMPQNQVVDCILNSADNIDAANPGFIGQLGSGRINAFGAVQCAQATVNAPPVALVNTTSTVNCPGSVVQFFGSSAGGLATGYEWTFPGGNPATSSDQNPLVVYSEAGFYDVILNVTNDFGEDETTFSSFMEISSNGIDIFFFEDFEGDDFDQLGWEVENANTWEIADVGGLVNGSKAAAIPLFQSNNLGDRDGLISPPISLSGHTNVVLDFQHAHRRRVATRRDSLIVYVSTDGGATFPHRVFSAAENGQGSFATGGIINQNFIPANGGDWCFGGDLGSGCFTVDLSDFDGETNVRLKFETYNDGGNNIYLNNVQLSGNCQLIEAAPIANFTSAATGVCVDESIQFVDQSINVPSTYAWTFEGGTPATSELATPTVTYSEPGMYDVTLVVSNEFGSDEVALEGYITVSEQPEIAISANATSICAGQTVTLTASGADTYLWSPPIGLSNTSGSVVEATPPTSLTYTAEGSNSGCSAVQTIDIEVLPAPAIPEVISQNQTAFAMLNPPAAQGHYPYTATSAANGWGNPPINTISVEGEMVVGRDNTVADSLLCNAAGNAGAINGKIAVVYRGGCEFGTKAANAQNAGAIGVIVVNNQPGAIIDMGAGALGGSVTIPALMVSQATGAHIQQGVNDGEASAVIGQFNGGGLMLCPGETLRLAAPGGQASYAWNTGHSSAVIEISEVGTYSVALGNEICTTSSTSFEVGMHNTTVPVIDWDGATTLFVDNVNATTYQWFLNGTPIANANSASYEATESGVYTVEATDNNGCITLSEPYDLFISSSSNAKDGKDEMRIYPVPSRGQVTIDLPATPGVYTLRIFSTEGRSIAHNHTVVQGGMEVTIDTGHWAPGTYLVQAVGQDVVYNGRLVKVE